MTSIIPAPPDPADDLVGYLRWLGDMVVSIKEGYKARRVTATEAARTNGYPDTYFRGKPWRIPGFGASGTRHSMADWDAWLARPESERRSEWDSLGVKERRKLGYGPA